MTLACLHDRVSRCAMRVAALLGVSGVRLGVWAYVRVGLLACWGHYFYLYFGPLWTPARGLQPRRALKKRPLRRSQTRTTDPWMCDPHPFLLSYHVSLPPAEPQLGIRF